jgi:quinol monooxygenase YgiN
MRPTFCLLTLMGILLATGVTIQEAAAQDPAGGVYVVTHVDITPNYAAEGAKLLHQFAMESRKDPGVVRFEALRQDSRPNHFTLVEVWRNHQAFDAHQEAEHTKAFREKLQPMLGSPFDERVHSLVQ